LRVEQAQIRRRLDEFDAELDILGERLEEQKELYAESAENVTQQRRELQKRSRNMEDTLKAVSALEEISNAIFRSICASPPL